MTGIALPEHGQGSLHADPAPLRKRITRDSLWLFSGYAATAGSGFVFWLLAALWIPQAELGVDASILAMIFAAAALASNGPGCALVVMLPHGGTTAAAVLWRGYGITAGLAAAFGVVAGILVSAFLLRDAPPIAVVAGVASSTVVWALFNLQTQALAGAGDARATLFVNAAANVAKLSLLFLFAVPWGTLEDALVMATILPAIVAVVISISFLVPRALRREERAGVQGRPWTAELAKTFRLFVAQNALAVGVVLGIGMSLSFFVTVLSTPTEGAVFAIAFQFGAVLDLVGVGVATALARSASTHFGVTADLARGYVWKVVGAVAALGLAVTLATPVMFLVLGRGYQPLYGMAVVGALALASLIRPGYDLWSALVRAQQRVLPVLVSNVAYVVVVLCAVLLLAPRFGALGAALAVVLAATVLGIIGAVGIHRLPHTPRRPALQGVVA